MRERAHWSGEAMESESGPEFKQILDSFTKLQEGRPYWGDGGNEMKCSKRHKDQFART